MLIYIVTRKHFSFLCYYPVYSAGLEIFTTGYQIIATPGIDNKHCIRIYRGYYSTLPTQCDAAITSFSLLILHFYVIIMSQ